MTPHTPVELLAKWRALRPFVSRSFWSDTDATIQDCADELEAALASLPVEGWVLVPRESVIVAGRLLQQSSSIIDSRQGAALLACISAQDQRQGNEQGGTHE